MRAVKGHGTENDFVLLPDLAGALTLTRELTQAICDRRRGIGADGVLRVVRSENADEAKQFAGAAEYFMDYRNADGSLAEMCGNGIRVFLRYLQRAGLVAQATSVATRGGIVAVRSGADGEISVLLGRPEVLVDRPTATLAPLGPRTALAAVRMPNPHVVVEVSVAELERLQLIAPPVIETPLRDGQNVEFVARIAARRLRMRVHERGVGETRSCGTGICAAVVAAATAAGAGADGTTWRVDSPGGTCRVVWHPDGSIELTGPAVIVAELELDDEWLAGQSGVRGMSPWTAR